MFERLPVAAARALGSRLLRSWHSDDYARAVAAEIEAHIALHTADAIRAGLTPAEAQRDARLSLGGAVQTRERCLDVMTFRWIVRWVAR